MSYLNREITGADTNIAAQKARDIANRNSITGVPKYQRAYRLEVGSPKIQEVYKSADEMYPDQADPERRKYIPPTEGGVIDITDKFAITPVDTSISGAPYWLNGKALWQDHELGFRIQFEIMQNDKPSNNFNKIKVYNPPEEFVTACNQDAATVKLFCGYVTERKIGQLLIGSISSTKYESQGPDQCLTIFVGDLAGTFATRHINRIFSANYSYANVVEHLADYIVRNDITLQGADILFDINTKLGKNLTISGDAYENLKNICRSYGFSVFKSAGMLKIRPATILSSFETAQQVKISDQSGLIGKPEFITKKKGGDGQGESVKTIRFKCLLDTEIQIRTRIFLSSKAFPTDITCVVTSQKIEGDSMGGAWYNIITADIVPAVGPSDVIFPNSNNTAGVTS